MNNGRKGCRGKGDVRTSMISFQHGNIVSWPFFIACCCSQKKIKAFYYNPQSAEWLDQPSRQCAFAPLKYPTEDFESTIAISRQFCRQCSPGTTWREGLRDTMKDFLPISRVRTTMLIVSGTVVRCCKWDLLVSDQLELMADTKNQLSTDSNRIRFRAWQKRRCGEGWQDP
jgi:hypothetical protein